MPRSMSFLNGSLLRKIYRCPKVKGTKLYNFRFQGYLTGFSATQDVPVSWASKIGIHHNSSQGRTGKFMHCSLRSAPHCYWTLSQRIRLRWFLHPALPSSQAAIRLFEWLSVAKGRRWMIHHMGDVWVLVTSTETC